MIRLVILIASFALLAACSNSSSGSRASPTPAPASPFAAMPLDLDFTFATTQVLDNPGTWAGVALDPETGIAYLANTEQRLFALTLTGEPLWDVLLEISGDIADLAFDDGTVLIAMRDGQVFTYDTASMTLSAGTEVPVEGTLAGIGFDDGARFALEANGDSPALWIDAQRSELAAEFALYTFHGLDAAQGELFILASLTSDGTPTLIVTDGSGSFVSAWELQGELRGIVALGNEERGPTVLVANTDADASVLQFEPPPQAGNVDLEALELLGTFEFEELAPQPSGITYDSALERLFVVTDFGVVASVNPDGSDPQVLFDASEEQGAYEAIELDAAGNIHLLGSDAGSPPELVQFTSDGVEIERSPLTEEDAVVEGYAIDQGTQFWVNAAESKVLTSRQTDGTTVEQPLDDAYDALTFAGLHVAQDIAFIVTDQREVDDEVFAGIILLWDIEDSDEIARFAVSADGVGVISPSGIAVDVVGGVVYVTSDTDEGAIYAYDLDL